MSGICRINDTTTGHSCYPSTICIEGSSDVIVNGLGVCRVDDHFATHCCVNEPFDCHDGTLSSGSSTVFANGRAVGRVGDPISCGDTIATGSPDCVVG